MGSMREREIVCVFSWGYMRLDLKCADDVCLARAIKGVYYRFGGFCPCVCMHVCVPCKHKTKCEGVFTLMDKNTVCLF